MRRAFLIAAMAVIAPWSILGAQPPVRADVASLLARVGTAIERYYARAQSVICVETVTVQPIRRDLMPEPFPARHLQYELRVAWEPGAAGASPEATAQRQLLKVNNRAPRVKDKPACTDPSDVTPDALAFLLPDSQSDYVFTLRGRDKVRGRDAITMDFKGRHAGPIELRPRDGVEDCWNVEMPGAYGGRIWIDEESAEVLRLDEHLLHPVDVTFPKTAWRPGKLDVVTLERSDTSTVYTAVTFSDPDETLLLPATIQSVNVASNLRERSITTLTNYRRFTADGRIVE
jgi:hypothetical protein